MPTLEADNIQIGRRRPAALLLEAAADRLAAGRTSTDRNRIRNLLRQWDARSLEILAEELKLD